MPDRDSTITIPLSQYAQMTRTITELTVTSFLLVDILQSKSSDPEGKGLGKTPKVADHDKSSEPGWYRDRTGRIWEKTRNEWRLHWGRAYQADETGALAATSGPFALIAHVSDTYSLCEAATLLQRNGADVSVHRFWSKLLELGWIDTSHVPTEASRGRLVIRTGAPDNPRDAFVRVTPEGINTLRDLLIDDAAAG